LKYDDDAIIRSSSNIDFVINNINSNNKSLLIYLLNPTAGENYGVSMNTKHQHKQTCGQKRTNKQINKTMGKSVNVIEI
jgi:hypothetical protein